MWSEFKSFLLKQNALALALAVVLGVALNAVVQAVVNDLIMPVVAIVTPSGDWQKSTLDIGPIHLLVGHLAGALLNFVIIGFVAWRISKMVEPPPGAPPRTCQYCKSTVDTLATRCAHCTSQLA